MNLVSWRPQQSQGAIASWMRLGITLGLLFSLLLGNAAPSFAAGVDPYVARFLDVSDPVELPLDETGATQAFTGRDISRGKRLYDENCKTCHVGGTTLPNPLVSLSLEDLSGAMPPRDTINSLVAFMREPMTYDGSEPTFWCREVPETWLSDEQLANLAAFLLRAADKGPGWASRQID